MPFCKGWAGKQWQQNPCVLVDSGQWSEICLLALECQWQVAPSTFRPPGRIPLRPDEPQLGVVVQAVVDERPCACLSSLCLTMRASYMCICKVRHGLQSVHICPVGMSGLLRVWRGVLLVLQLSLHPSLLSAQRAAAYVAAARRGLRLSACGLMRQHSCAAIVCLLCIFMGVSLSWPRVLANTPGVV
jgi:hypothetical protein